jgi:hypothetical protein
VQHVRGAQADADAEVGYRASLSISHRTRPLKAKRQVCHDGTTWRLSSDQYFGAGAAEALHDDLPGAAAALHDDLPLPAGAAFALHEDLPPAADGSDAAGVAPPHPIAEPISIPATAETARVFARFIASSSPQLLL